MKRKRKWFKGKSQSDGRKEELFEMKKDKVQVRKRTLLAKPSESEEEDVSVAIVELKTKWNAHAAYPTPHLFDGFEWTRVKSRREVLLVLVLKLNALFSIWWRLFGSSFENNEKSEPLGEEANAYARATLCEIDWY